MKIVNHKANPARLLAEAMPSLDARTAALESIILANLAQFTNIPPAAKTVLDGVAEARAKYGDKRRNGPAFP